MNSTSLSPSSSSSSSSSVVGGVTFLRSDGFHGLGYGTAITMGIIFVATIITIIICYFLRWKNNASDSYQWQNAVSSTADLVDVEKGIDEKNLKNYPKVIYGEDEARFTSYDRSCSICLSDYKEAQILQLLPDCNHMFHTECVDEWLRRHPTCPICRCTPLPSMSMTTPPVDS